MDLLVEECIEKLNVLIPLMDNLNKKIGEYLFISKEIVWLIFELKPSTFKRKPKQKKKKGEKVQIR